MGDGNFLRSGVITPIECLHYSMSLPSSAVITGCDSMRILDQALNGPPRFVCADVGIGESRFSSRKTAKNRRLRQLRALQDNSDFRWHVGQPAMAWIIFSRSEEGESNDEKEKGVLNSARRDPCRSRLGAFHVKCIRAGELAAAAPRGGSSGVNAGRRPPNSSGGSASGRSERRNQYGYFRLCCQQFQRTGGASARDQHGRDGARQAPQVPVWVPTQVQ